MSPGSSSAVMERSWSWASAFVGKSIERGAPAGPVAGDRFGDGDLEAQATCPRQFPWRWPQSSLHGRDRWPRPDATRDRVGSAEGFVDGARQRVVDGRAWRPPRASRCSTWTSPAVLLQRGEDLGARHGGSEATDPREPELCWNRLARAASLADGRARGSEPSQRPRRGAAGTPWAMQRRGREGVRIEHRGCDHPARTGHRRRADRRSRSRHLILRLVSSCSAPCIASPDAAPCW